MAEFNLQDYVLNEASKLDVYWPNFDAFKTQSVLQGPDIENGTYILRPSTTIDSVNRRFLTLSVRMDFEKHQSINVCHFPVKIDVDPNSDQVYFSLTKDCTNINSLRNLLDYYHDKSVKGETPRGECFAMIKKGLPYRPSYNADNNNTAVQSNNHSTVSPVIPLPSFPTSSKENLVSPTSPPVPSPRTAATLPRNLKATGWISSDTLTCVGAPATNQTPHSSATLPPKLPPIPDLTTSASQPFLLPKRPPPSPPASTPALPPKLVVSTLSSPTTPRLPPKPAPKSPSAPTPPKRSISQPAIPTPTLPPTTSSESAPTPPPKSPSPISNETSVVAPTPLRRFLRSGPILGDSERVSFTQIYDLEDDSSSKSSSGDGEITQNPRDEHCPCGIPANITLLPENWTVHRSHEPESMNMLYFKNSAGRTAWALPPDIDAKCGTREYLKYGRLNVQCFTEYQTYLKYSPTSELSQYNDYSTYSSRPTATYTDLNMTLANHRQ